MGLIMNALDVFTFTSWTKCRFVLQYIVIHLFWAETYFNGLIYPWNYCDSSFTQNDRACFQTHYMWRSGMVKIILVTLGCVWITSYKLKYLRFRVPPTIRHSVFKNMWGETEEKLCISWMRPKDLKLVARAMKEWLYEKYLKVLQWPLSPHLNLLEILWTSIVC